MADGLLCTGEHVIATAEEFAAMAKSGGGAFYRRHRRCDDDNSAIGDGGGCGDDKLYEDYRGGGDDTKQMQEEFVCDDDCRKKRCVDRYDSSESSDSGVATLSCTDCSGSSTASSDITDPGSPFSTASNHSEDSSSTKMPPTPQTAHHPPWPWTADDAGGGGGGGTTTTAANTTATALSKRTMQLEKTVFPKRLKSNEDIANTTTLTANKQSPPCLNNNNNSHKNEKVLMTTDAVVPAPGCNLKGKVKRVEMIKQGKITEYFKTQVKLHMFKKELKSTPPPTKLDQQTQFNGMRLISRSVSKKTSESVGGGGTKPSRKVSHHVTVPRKILPAPSKLPDAATAAAVPTLNHHPQVNFAPAMTLTAVSFPPNLAYLHTKAPKPPDNGGGIFVPQFTTINNATHNIPIINRTPCLNVLQPMPKIINNFNCVKLNATVVPIVKLNTLGAATPSPPTLSVETAQPTVVTVKPKVAECAATATSAAPRIIEDKSPSPAESSDSGVSVKDLLEVEVTVEAASTPPQKSPILSQPKTIRFPPAKQEKDEVKEKSTSSQQESGLCRWAECSAQFDTSGALLEHLQIKHVISQATQEHYVCLWLGCKVHGRTSCSRSWLERHVLAHAGTKPFRCIVDGCGQRFNSQLTLERHVNGHFNTDGSQNGSAKKSTESSSVKLFKRNGKKIRFRRQPWSARMFDFIDAGIMEGLQFKLLKTTQERTMGQIHDAGNAVNVTSHVIARRVGKDGKTNFLVKWQPDGILPDEWVTEKEFVQKKSVHIPSLQPAAKDALNSRLFPQERRRRRKPSKQPT